LSKGRRILLVDDELDNNRIFTIVFRDNGFEVDMVVDPQSALSAFKPNYYDLVILDVRMPHTEYWILGFMPILVLLRH
jgi:DNA-binding response OmpR family regulator